MYRTPTRIVSPAQAYHGATLGALSLVGRPALQRPFDEYQAAHVHDSPAAMYAHAGLDAKGIVAKVFDALGKDYKTETVKLA